MRSGTTQEADALWLTDAQRAELDYRIERHEQNPSAVNPWEQVRGDCSRSDSVTQGGAVPIPYSPDFSREQTLSCSRTIPARRSPRDNFHSRPSLRVAADAAGAGVHFDRRSHPGHRHRRDHRHLHPGARHHAEVLAGGRPRATLSHRRHAGRAASTVGRTTTGACSPISSISAWPPPRRSSKRPPHSRPSPRHLRHSQHQRATMRPVRCAPSSSPEITSMSSASAPCGSRHYAPPTTSSPRRRSR